MRNSLSDIYVRQNKWDFSLSIFLKYLLKTCYLMTQTFLWKYDLRVFYRKIKQLTNILKNIPHSFIFFYLWQPFEIFKDHNTDLIKVKDYQKFSLCTYFVSFILVYIRLNAISIHIILFSNYLLTFFFSVSPLKLPTFSTASKSIDLFDSSFSSFLLLTFLTAHWVNYTILALLSFPLDTQLLFVWFYPQGLPAQEICFGCKCWPFLRFHVWVTLTVSGSHEQAG